MDRRRRHRREQSQSSTVTAEPLAAMPFAPELWNVHCRNVTPVLSSISTRPLTPAALSGALAANVTPSIVIPVAFAMWPSRVDPCGG